PSCHVPINRLDGTRSELPALATPVAAPSPTHIGRPARERTLQMFTRLQRLRSAIAIGAVIGAFACGSARAADAPAARATDPARATDTARATAPAPATDAARAAAPARPKSTLGDTTRPATFLKETVVTGARYPRPFFESPQAMSFLSHAQLRDLVPNVIGDAFQQLPGVDNSKDSPWEQRPVLRGLSGQRVL